MIFTETGIDGLLLVDMEPVRDDRGFFARAWSAREFAERGLPTAFPEVNFSLSRRKGTIRGLHYQKSPHGEAKFVRCVRGSFFDVVVDLRPESPTLHEWRGFEIRAEDRRAVLVPEGCAHGIMTLEDDTEMLYMVSACYHPGSEGGIRWNDPFFGIAWPDTGGVTVSQKDNSWPDFVPSPEPIQS